MDRKNDLKKKFNSKIQNMERLLELLLSRDAYKPIDILCCGDPQLTDSGVYAFSIKEEDTEKFLYIGQSNNIGTRLEEHCAIKNHKAANFAYKETVQRYGQKPIPCSPNSTKESMFFDPIFEEHFYEVINDIKHMNYRWIPISSALEKNLFEIYASVVLESKYNNFD
jgi:hypothetical protein